MITKSDLEKGYVLMLPASYLASRVYWKIYRGGWVLTSGKASLNRGCRTFQPWLLEANTRLCASDEVTDPVVISSESMNDRRPVKLEGHVS